MSRGPIDSAPLPEATAQRHDEFWQSGALQASATVASPKSSPPIAKEVRDDRSEFGDAMDDEAHATVSDAAGVAARARQHKESVAKYGTSSQGVPSFTRWSETRGSSPAEEVEKGYDSDDSMQSTQSHNSIASYATGRTDMTMRSAGSSYQNAASSLSAQWKTKAAATAMAIASNARGSQGAPSPDPSGFQGLGNITDEMALQAQFEEYLEGSNPVHAMAETLVEATINSDYDAGDDTCQYTQIAGAMLLLGIIIGAYAYHRHLGNPPNAVLQRLVRGNQRMMQLTQLIHDILASPPSVASGPSDPSRAGAKPSIIEAGSRAIDEANLRLRVQAHRDQQPPFQRCRQGEGYDWWPVTTGSQDNPDGSASSGFWPEAPAIPPAALSILAEGHPAKSPAPQPDDQEMDVDSSASQRLAHEEAMDNGTEPSISSSQEEEGYRALRDFNIQQAERRRRAEWQKQALEETFWRMASETLHVGGIAQTYVADNLIANTGCEVTYEFALLAGLQWPAPPHLEN